MSKTTTKKPSVAQAQRQLAQLSGQFDRKMSELQEVGDKIKVASLDLDAALREQQPESPPIPVGGRKKKAKAVNLPDPEAQAEVKGRILFTDDDGEAD